MANPEGDTHITEPAAGVGAGNANTFADALRHEVLACRSNSDLAPGPTKDQLEMMTRKTQTDALHLPVGASPLAICNREAEVSIKNGLQAVAKLDKGLDKGDLDTLNGAVLDMHMYNYPETEKAVHESVDTLLQSRGLGHSWSKDGDLSIFKDNGQTATIATLSGIDAKAMQVEKDSQGHITRVTPEEPHQAVRELLAH